METPLLITHLHRVGRRLLAVRLASGLGWGLGAAIAVLLLGAWLDLLWELTPELRITAVALAGTAGVGVILGQAAIGWRGRDARRIASRMDRAAGTGGEILAGVDLTDERKEDSPLTVGLAHLAVERAGRVAAEVQTSRVAPARPIAWAVGALGGLGIGVGLIALCLPRLAETQWLRLSDPYGDHPPYSRVLYHVEPGDVQVVYGKGLDITVTTEGPPVDRLFLVLQPADGSGEETVPMFPEPGGEWRATLANVTASGRYFVRSHAGRSAKFGLTVLTVPRFEAVRFRITPPAYTNLPAYDGPLPQGGLSGLPGTRVQLWVKSNRPLRGGTLHAPGLAAPVTLAPVAPDSPEATGTFAICTPGKLHVRLEDTDGQPSSDPYSTSITVLTDERPMIRLLEPPPLSLATPNVALPVTVAAEDDYGITRLELFRSLNDSRPLPVAVQVKTPPPTRWSATVTLPLSTYGLEPGDEIKLFARVEDNDPAGAKGAESAIAVIRIISQEDFERLARARKGVELLMTKYRQAQRRLEKVREEADRLRKKTRDKDSAREVRAELRKLAEKMREEAEAMRLSAQKPLGYDLDKHLTEHLRRLSRRLEEAARDAEKLASENEVSPEELAKKLEELRDRLHREQEAYREDTLEPLDRLGLLQPLIEAAARFVQIYKRQRALAERLKSVVGQDRVTKPALKARFHDLQTEQEEIRTALGKLLDDLEDLATKLPDEPDFEELRKSVLDFTEAVRNSGATEAMSEAEGGLASFSGTRGHDGAKKAADILEKFLNKAEGEDGFGGTALRNLRFQPGLRDGLGDTVEQLLRDAGLQPGREGKGGVGGLSLQRNTLENVGLYGNVPGLGELPGSRPSTRSRAGGNGPTSGRGGDAGQPTGNDPRNSPTVGGPGEGMVPAQYRRRVAEYFQRLADESGGK